MYEKMAAALFDWEVNGDWWNAQSILDSLGIEYDHCDATINSRQFFSIFDREKLMTIWENKTQGTTHCEFPDSMFV